MSTSKSTEKDKGAKDRYTDTPVSGLTPETLLAQARLDLMMRFPFFGKIAMHLNYIETERVPTTAVDAKGNFYYNPRWVNSFTREDALYETSHEVMHMAQRLWSRFQKGMLHATWNMAADIHADTSLTESGMVQSSISKEVVTPERMELTKTYDTVPKLYNHLMEEAKDNTDCKACKNLINELMNKGKKQQGQGAPSDEKGDEKESGEGEGKDQHEGHSHGDGEPCEHEHEEEKHTCGNVRQCCAGSLADMEGMNAEDAQKWTEVVVGAKIHAESKGNMPAGLGKYIDTLTESKVRWTDYLRNRATRLFGRSRYTVKRPNRRGPAIGLRIPSRQPDGYTAVLSFDTSGSMSVEELQQCFAEGVEILRICGCQKIWVILSDSRVYYSGWVESTDFTNLEIARGGTSHTEVFECLDRTHKNQEFNVPKDCEVTLAVMFTDLDTNFPDKAPDYDVIWGVPSVAHSKSKEVPFGMKVEVDVNA